MNCTPCGKAVDFRGPTWFVLLHRHIRSHHMNNFLWRAIKWSQIPAIKEPVSLLHPRRMENLQTEPHRYLGYKASPWHGLLQSPTLMLSHQTAREPEQQQTKPRQARVQDSQTWSSFCLTSFFSVAVETGGTLYKSAIELVQEIGKHITSVSWDTRETVFLFQ